MRSLAILSYGLLFTEAFIPSSVSNNYLNQLQKHTQDMKAKRLRRTRDWDMKKRKNIIEQQDLGNFNITNINNQPVEIEIPQKLFIPLSQMSALFGNQTRKVRRSKDSSSDNDQFILEKNMENFNFSCVGGYNDLKQELHQILDFVFSPEKYTQYGLRLPRGILLEGPTGNGKTLIAKCLAGEAKMNFVSCSGAEFMEKYVGVGASRVRELFKFVKQNTPCILFVDEIDALGRKRGNDAEASNSERDQTLNQLLVLMDGFHGNEDNILVIAATNRLDMLDSAIIRPGRFDKIIHVPNPDADTRKEIIEIHSDKKPLNITNSHLVRLTNGLNGAQIENILNEATLSAIRENSLPVNIKHIEYIKEKMLIGQTSNFKRNITESTLRRVAIHEVGHLLMAMQSPCYEKPWKITIESMNPKHSLGYTIFETEEIDEGFFLREYLQDKIKVLLGGRAAEDVIYGHSVSSGAFSDLEKAFDVARTMIMDYGMGTKIIYPYLSETYKKQIDEQIHFLILQMYNETREYIQSHQKELNLFVEQLLIKKTLVWNDIQDLYTQVEASENDYTTNF
jgi:cell division protease FtsH